MHILSNLPWVALGCGVFVFSVIVALILKKGWRRVFYGAMSLGFVSHLFVSLSIIATVTVGAYFLRCWALGRPEMHGFSEKLWGLKQLSDSSEMCITLRDVDRRVGSAHGDERLWVLVAMSIGSCLLGFMIIGVVNGVIVDGFRRCAEVVSLGKARYRLRHHGIVIGWDFQGVASVMALFDQYKCKEVLIVTEKPKSEVLREIDNEFEAKQLKKIFIYNGSVAVAKDVHDIFPENARAVIILGDRKVENSDGGNMRVSRIIREYVRDGRPRRIRHRLGKLPLLVNIQNLYNFMFYEVFPHELDDQASDPDVDVKILNFCRQSIVEVYSSLTQFQAFVNTRAGDCYAEARYIPLAFRRNPEANHVHLVFSDFTDMTMAAIVHLIPLVGIGREIDKKHAKDVDFEDKVNNQITVFYDHDDERVCDEVLKFKNAFRFDELCQKANVDFRFVESDICDHKNENILREIARDKTSSVTLFVVNESPDRALEKFNRLPNVLKYEAIRVLVEHRGLSRWAPSKRPLNSTGFGRVDFFGFTDRCYSSLRNFDELARMLKSEIRTETNRLRVFREAQIYAGLEYLSAQNLVLDYNSYGLSTLGVSAEFPRPLQRSEHYRNVAFKILHGACYAKEVDAYSNRFKELRTWDEVSADDDGRLSVYNRRLSNLDNAIVSVFGGRGRTKGKDDDLSYGIFPRHFVKMLGVVPYDFDANGRDARARGFDDQLEVRGKLIKNILMPLIEASRRRPLVQESTKKKSRLEKDYRLTQASVAILLVPDLGLTYDVIQTAYNMGIPIIAVFDKEPDEFLAEYIKTARDNSKRGSDVEFNEAALRDRFERFMRNVYSYYVVQAKSQSELAGFVARHSDEILSVSYNQPENLDVETYTTSPLTDAEKDGTSFRWLPVREVYARHHVLVGEPSKDKAGARSYGFCCYIRTGRARKWRACDYEKKEKDIANLRFTESKKWLLRHMEVFFDLTSWNGFRDALRFVGERRMRLFYRSRFRQAWMAQKLLRMAQVNDAETEKWQIQITENGRKKIGKRWERNIVECGRTEKKIRIGYTDKV